MTILMDLWWTAQREAEWTMFPYLRLKGWQVEFDPGGTGLWNHPSVSKDWMLIKEAVLVQEAIEAQVTP